MLVLAVGAGAQQRRDDSGCKRQTLSGSPEGNTAGAAGCHIITDVNTGFAYRFQGIIGQTTGWAATERGGPTCGDGSINQASEQCDAPGGIGAQGVCQALADCQPNCTCVPASSTCGNGMLDAGEGCDPALIDSPCRGSILIDGVSTPKCTGACKCIAECPNGQIETNTTTGVDENCEFTTDPGGTGGVDFGNSGDFPGTGYFNTGEDLAALDITTGDLVVEMFARLDSTATSGRLVSKGGTSAPSNPGWTAFFNAGTPGVMSLQAADASTSNPCFSSAFLNAGTLYHLVWERSGTACTFYALNVTDNETAHTQVNGTDAATMATWAGGGNMGLGASSSGSQPLDVVMDEIRVWTGSGCVASYNSSIRDQLWDEEVTTDQGSCTLSARYDFDQPSPSTVENTVTGADVASANGPVALIASPFSTGSGGGGTTEFGCTPPQTCTPTTCRCSDTGTSTGRTFYLDDTGCSNSNAGATTGAPWCTVNWARDATNPSRLAPGDLLIIRDGTYTQEVSLVGGDTIPALTANGLCNGVGANALCGTSSAPITIRAENSRQAKFVSPDGDGDVWAMNGLAWYVVDGLVIENVDHATGGATGLNSNLGILRSSNLTFKNMLYNKSNRCGNNQLVEVNDGQDILFQFNEFWRHHRHGLSVAGGIRVVCDRCYENTSTSAVWDQCPSGAGCLASCTTTGGTASGAYEMYPCNNCTIQTSLMEGLWGSSIMGAPGSINGIRAADNWIIGSAYAPVRSTGGTGLGAKIFARGNENPIRGPLRTRLQDFVVVDARGLAIRNSVAVDTQLDHVAAWDVTANTNPTLLVDDPGFDANSQATCENLLVGEDSSITITNSIFAGSTGTNVSIPGCTSSATENQVCTIGTGTTGNRAGSGTSFSCPSDGGNCNAACAAATAWDRALPTGIGPTATDCYHGAGFAANYLGADLRCLYANRVRLTGIANSQFCGTTGAPGCGSMIVSNATCTATRGAGVPTPCQNGINWCGVVVPGINDTDGCVSFAHRRLRQLADDSECGGGSIALTCP
jgi:hypothetical protein